MKVNNYPGPDPDETMLWKLFDFQRFAGNRRLDRIIRSAAGTADPVPLTDDQLELNAAGEPEAWRLLPDDSEKPWTR